MCSDATTPGRDAHKELNLRLALPENGGLATSRGEDAEADSFEDEQRALRAAPGLARRPRQRTSLTARAKRCVSARRYSWYSMAGGVMLSSARAVSCR